MFVGPRGPGDGANDHPLRSPELRIAMLLTALPCRGSAPCQTATPWFHGPDLRRLRSCGTSFWSDQGYAHAYGGAGADQRREHGTTH